MDKDQMEKLGDCVKVFGGGCLGVTIVIVAVLILAGIITGLISIPVFLIWNWIMPSLFGLPVITFLQTMGLVFICGILFKGGSSK